MSRSPNSSSTAESPNSPTSLPPASLPTSALFLPPKGPAAPLPPPSPSSSMSGPTPSSLPPADDGAAPTWSPESADGAEMRELPPDSSDTPSTGSGPTLSKAAFAAFIGRGVVMASRLVHRLAATAAEREYGLWLADGDDINDIAGPASRLAWRRIPREARNADLVDITELAFAVGGYVQKNLADRAMIRQRAAAGDEQPDPDPAAPGTAL